MKRAAGLYLAGLSAVFATGGALLLLSDDPELEATQPDLRGLVAEHARPAPRVSAHAQGAKAPCLLAPAVGRTWGYALETSFDLQTGGQTFVRLGARGELDVTCYRRDAEAVVLGERYRLQLESDQQEPGSLRRLEREVSCEVLLELDHRGRLRALALPSSSSVEARNLLRSLVAARRFALPAQPAATWKARGQDPTGRYTSGYRTLAATSAGVPALRRRTYVTLNGAARGKARVSVSGALHGVLRQDGTLAGLSGTEHLQVEAPGSSGFALRARYAYRVTGEGVVPAAEARRRLARLEQTLGPSAWERGLAAEVASGRLFARSKRPVGPILSDLIAIATRADFAQRAPKLFIELWRRFQIDDGAVASALPLLRSAAQDLKVRSTIADALGEAGTPSAQRGLLAALADPRVDERLLPSLFLALGAVREPLPQLLARLQREARGEEAFRAQWASRAMGFIAARTPDAALKQRLARDLEEDLGGDPRDDLVILEALGNAGQARSLPALMTYVADERADLRAGATAALRKLTGPVVDQLLVGLARRDASEQVRREAVRSLGSRPVNDRARAALQRVLAEEPSAAVRLEALDAIGSWLSAGGDARLVAGLRTLLRTVSARDAAPSVRAAALEALNSEAA